MSAAPPQAGSTIRGSRWRAALVLIVAALAVVVGVLTVLQPGMAAAIAAGLGLVAVLSLTRSVPRSIDLQGKRFRWVAVAWVYVLIRPIGHFTTGRTSLTAVGGVPSVENLLDLATHASIAALALWSLRRNRFGLRPSWLLFALPVLALLSAGWSLAPTVTLGFSFELVAVVLLASLTAAIRGADPDLARSILRRTLRLAVQGVALLCLVGLAFPHSAGSAALADPTDTRFTWPGEHPLVASAEIGFALLALAFGGRRDTGFAWPARAALLALFGTCLYLGQARTAQFGLGVSALFGYWFITHGRGPARRLAGAAAIAAVALLVVASFGGAITHYVYRGQSQQQVFGLNGRLGLWTLTLNQLHSAGHWLVGYGLGASRVLLASSVAWAGDAHSAWIELLLSLGLLGVATGVALVVVLGVRVLRAAAEPDAPSRALPILFVYLLAMSPAATGFASPGPEPGMGFTLLAFCYAATASRESVRARAPAAPRPRLTADLRPAPT